jgi:F5/8 type C domain
MPTLISPNNMTADNAPSPYVASASSEYSGEAAWEAFDGVLTNYWLGSSGLPAWLEIDLGTAQVVGSYSIQADSVNPLPLAAMPAAWTLQGSNDGTTWNIVDAQEGQPAWASSELRTFTCHVETAAYRYFRVYITDTPNGTYAQIPSLCLYQGTASGTTPADFAPHVLTSDTSDPPYVVSSSAALNPDYLAFDGNHGSAWVAAWPCWIQLDTGAGNSYVLDFYTIWSCGDVGTQSGPTAWTMEGSNDGATWTTLDTQMGISAFAYPGNSLTFPVSGAAAYRYFRLNITGSNSGADAEVDELYLYGIPYSAPAPTQRGNIAYDQIKASDRTGNGDQLLTWNTTAPAHSTSTGTAGQIGYDSSGNYYFCFAANQWARLGPSGYSITF